jgi:hypothetical protein
MNNPNQPVLAHHLTTFFQAIVVVIDGLILAANMDRSSIAIAGH